MAKWQANKSVERKQTRTKTKIQIHTHKEREKSRVWKKKDNDNITNTKQHIPHIYSGKTNSHKQAEYG